MKNAEQHLEYASTSSNLVKAAQEMLATAVEKSDWSQARAAQQILNAAQKIIGEIQNRIKLDTDAARDLEK